jgi:hypothetical protein
MVKKLEDFYGTPGAIPSDVRMTANEVAIYLCSFFKYCRTIY